MSISNFGAAGAKPGVCTSTTRPSTPYTGQIIFEVDTGYLRVWDGAAWDYLSQSQNDTTNFPVNTIGAGTAYTPTFSDFTLGNGTADFRYTRAQKFVFVRGRISCGSTTAFTGVLKLTLPFNTAVNIDNTPLGVVWFFDVSVGLQVYGPVSTVTNNRVMLNAYSAGGTYVGIAYTGVGVPFTIASGDVMEITFSYEAA